MRRARNRLGRADNLVVAKEFCARLGHPNVTRQQAADILEDHLGWERSRWPSTRRIAKVLEYLREEGKL